MPTRYKAWKLLCEYTASEILGKHILIGCPQNDNFSSFSGRGGFASIRYGAVCVGKALEPVALKWKRMSHSLGTLWPPTSGEENCQRRAAFSARSEKYLLGPGESSAASETLPVGSTWTRTLTRTMP